MEKSELRTYMLSKRRAMSSIEVERAGIEIQRRVIESDMFAVAKHIASYIPIGNEVATSAIHQAAYAEEKIVVVPFIEQPPGEYCFAKLESESALQRGGDGALQPVGTEHADISSIDIMLVPGVAFSRAGARLGRGGAVYDSLLSSASAVKVGVCYGFQIEADIPCEPHDQSVDWIATEDEFFKVECKIEINQDRQSHAHGRAGADSEK